MSKLTIVRGLPGSGKSTYVKRHFNCLHLENDMFFVKDGKYDWDGHKVDYAIMWCTDTCRHALTMGMDVVVSNTFTKKRYINVYKAIAEAHGADFEVIRCTGDFGNVHNVPKYILENMKKGFEDYEGEVLAEVNS